MKITTFLSLVVLVCVLGCQKPSDDEHATSGTPSPVVMDGPPPMIDEHAHPDHGPNGGELIELGKEDFHAELVHGKDGVSIHVLDGTATKAVAIAAQTLTVSLKHEGEVQSFELTANAQSGDAEGTASRFTSNDPQLGKWLDAGAEGAVVIQIEGKSFTGKIAHDHDHDHGSHDHGSHDVHDHDAHDH